MKELKLLTSPNEDLQSHEFIINHFNKYCEKHNVIPNLHTSSYSIDTITVTYDEVTFKFWTKYLAYLVKFNNKFCCGEKKTMFEQYDTYGCLVCDTWKEDVCSCPDAEQCSFQQTPGPALPSKALRGE